MSYETAPATLLLATSCASCHRPLVDADSVEAGMGPDCRRRHGYGKPDRPPVPLTVAVALAAAFGPAGIPSREATTMAAQDHRALCNQLVHRIAAEKMPDPAHAVVAIEALGFRRLAEALTKGLADTHAVRVQTEGEVLVVKAKFSEAFNLAVRSVRGARWDAARKARIVPRSERAALWSAIKQAFGPGTVVIGDERMAVVS